MNELTLKMECWGHKELKDYLLSLSGVFEVNINESANLLINIKYNSKLISVPVLKMEILLFLDVLKTPSLISFDKHTKNKTKKHNIVITDLCCEYCFRGMIEDLLMIDGIEKVISNFEDDPYQNKENVIISIFYDPKLISKEEMKKIELKFNS